ncbi:MAG: translation initiation factor [Bacteroidia bacterium]|nr:translation initiation factor [Bacteroidia bacterium]
MSKNKKNISLSDLGGLVYSTDPDFSPQTELPEVETPAPEKQNLKITLNKRLKGGKIATVISGFQGSQDNLEKLAKHLKNKCACGGSAKEGEIIIQGSFLEKVKAELSALGYKYKVSGV